MVENITYKLFYNHWGTGLFMFTDALREIKKNGLKNLELIYEGTIDNDRTDSQITEYLFRMTSGEEGENPLSAPAIQKIIKKSKAKHTSLSVGDVVVIKREDKETTYVCDDFGWYNVAEGERTLSMDRQ